MAEFLIENGANVNSTLNNLKTLLHFALVLNHEEFVILLLQNGASLNAMDQDKKI
jgi:ankyrin repeat protein